MHIGLLMLSVLAAACLCIAAQPADAAKHNTFISITLSETCKKTDCVRSSQELYKLDNSTRTISGQFWKKGDEIYRKPGLQNSHNFYNVYSGKLFVFFDPDQATLVRSKQIIVLPSLSEFAPPGQNTKTELNHVTTTRVTYSGAWVDQKCSIARVGLAQNIPMNDVISHLASGCTTDLGNAINHTETKTKISYCGQECQHQKWLKDAMEKSKKNLLGNKR